MRAAESHYDNSKYEMTTRLCRVLNWGVVQVLSVTVRALYTQVDFARKEEQAGLGEPTTEEQATGPIMLAH